MNKFSITAVFLAMALVFSSCNLLDVKSPSSFEPEIVFSDPMFAEHFLLGAYDRLGVNMSYRNRLIHTFSNADTELHREGINGTGQNTRRALAIFNIRSDNTDINGANNPYTFAYEAIERLNLLLVGIREHGDLEDPAMARVYGEALALRAFFYFDLIRWHGDVPARFEPVGPATLFIGRTDRDEIYIQILEDLRIAAEKLPWPGESASHSRTYRMNRAFAHAFRARIALHAGGYSLRADNGPGAEGVIRLSNHPGLTALYPGAANPRDAMYRIARAETHFLLTEGRGFRLEDNFEQIFRDNMAEIASTGRESIFELPYSPGNRGQWLSFFGLRHLGFDRFNGSSSNVKGEAGPSPIMWYWFNDRDLRRDVSVVPFRYDGLYSAANVPATRAIQVIQAPTNTPTVRTWYFGKLRAEWGVRRMMGNDDGIRPIVMRAADIWLMFAEAQNELEGPTTDFNGLTAQYALRQIRERAFDPADHPEQVDAYLDRVSADGDVFFQAIMDERAFEFLGELRRKYDLNRWNKLRNRLDWARAQTVRMRNFAGMSLGAPGNALDIDFSSTPRHIFWRHVPHPTFGENVQILEFFGFNRGEFPRVGQLTREDQSGTIIVVDHLPHTPTQNQALVDWMNSFEGGDINPWNPYTGTGEAQIEWIDRRVDQNGRPLSPHFINNGFYMQGVNPDQRSLFPIWARQIADSQGHLWNYFGY